MQAKFLNFVKKEKIQDCKKEISSDIVSEAGMLNFRDLGMITFSAGVSEDISFCR